MSSHATWIGLTLLLAVTPAQAQDCGLANQGEGRVAAVIDGRSLRLDDGRDIRLSGLAPLPPGHAARATAALAPFVGASVTLHGDSDTPDRYGRQTMLVRDAGTGNSIQAELLAKGDALVDLTLTACDAPFRAAESAARRGKIGIWRDDTVIKNAESAGDILAGIGRFSVVEGRVLSVRQAGSVTYINFGRRWTQDFAVTIPGRALPLFAAAGLTPNAFAGKRLRIRGFIVQRGARNGRQYGPGIEAIRPEQIEIAGATDVAGASE